MAHDIQADPRMTPEELLDGIRVRSAHPGRGAIVVPPVRDQDLCVHCMEPLASHGAVHGRDWHAPVPLNRITPGVHPQADRDADIQAAEVEAHRYPRRRS